MKSLMFPVVAATLLLAIQSSAIAREVELRAISMAGDFPGKEVFVHSPGSKEPGAKLMVKTFLNHEADAITTQADSLVFTAKADASSAKDPTAVLAQVNIPAGLKSGIVIFLPDAKNKSHTTLLIDDGKSAFPPGSTQVINSTGSEMRLEIEGKKFEVKAGGILLIRDQPVGDNNSSSVEGFAKTGAEWEPFTSSMWSHPGSKRVLQIATENAQSGKIELRGVRDIIAPR